MQAGLRRASGGLSSDRRQRWFDQTPGCMHPLNRELGLAVRSIDDYSGTANDKSHSGVAKDVGKRGPVLYNNSFMRRANRFCLLTVISGWQYARPVLLVAAASRSPSTGRSNGGGDFNHRQKARVPGVVAWVVASSSQPTLALSETDTQLGRGDWPPAHWRGCVVANASPSTAVSCWFVGGCLSLDAMSEARLGLPGLGQMKEGEAHPLATGRVAFQSHAIYTVGAHHK